MRLIILLLCLLSLNNCTYFVAKETAKIVLDTDKNPEKKEKILKKQNLKKEANKKKAKDFYCSKIEDPVKCNE
jgi:hypothetical protein|tara:strand:- start:554 stop:772 length:219 start_codon:yes stop_codon:yes gene_type:complete